MRNLKITCSWNGQNFSGYQIQPNSNTIEGVLTKAWNTLSRDEAKIIGCSRLDAGVHAEQYVFNVITKSEMSVETIVKSFNGILHENGNSDICIYTCEDVELSFHARFSATGKHYRYHIWHGVGEHVSYRDKAWHLKTHKPLTNLENILKIFEGTHDFHSFRASDCGSKNTIKTIFKISVSQNHKFPELYTIDIFGDGFLKNMIRNLIGAAILVIKDKMSEKRLQERLQSAQADYNLCAPACGLTLMQVFYTLPI